MSYTKILICEQVMYRISGGYPSVPSAVQEEDVLVALGQLINLKLKTEHLTVTMPAGETIPEGAMLATYESIAVVSYGKRAKATLPAMPVMLPRNMGVFQVGDDDYPYIPIQAGQWSLIRSQPLINDLLGQVGYEVNGADILFTKDITVDDINSVKVKLVVMDISKYGDYDMLPISADMAAEIIETLVKQFSQPVQRDSVVDSAAETNKS